MASLGLLHPMVSLEWREWPSISDPQTFKGSRIPAPSAWFLDTLFVGCSDNCRLCLFKPDVDQKWSFINTPTHCFGLATHDSKLLLVGGLEERGFVFFKHSTSTNCIFTLSDGKFVKSLPPMIHDVRSPAVVSYRSVLFVAGGGSIQFLKDGQWNRVPFQQAEDITSSALINDEWFLVTWEDDILSISLSSLVSDNTLSFDTLPNTPIKDAARARHILVCLNEQLLLVTSDLLSPRPSGDALGDAPKVHAFSPLSRSWLHIADLPTQLKDCASAITLPSGELVVVGLGDKVYARVFAGYMKFAHFQPADLLSSKFTVPQLFRLNDLGINLIEALSNYRFRFLDTAGIQSSIKKEDISLLSKEEFFDSALTTWQRNEGTVYPATWGGLFAVLDKMDLGELVEPITSIITTDPGVKIPIQDPYMKSLSSSSGQQQRSDVSGDGSGDVPPKPEEEIAKVLQNVSLGTSQSEGSGQQTQVESQDTPKLKVQKQPSAQKDLFNIPEVTVDGRTSFIVTNSAQSFSWDDHGLNLHVPQDSLPAGVPDCRLDFITSSDGECLLPPDHESFSPAYWVSSTPHCVFQKPLTLEIQHCAELSLASNLTFLKASHSQGKLPYEFRAVEENCSFSISSPVGSLEVYGFSGFLIACLCGITKKLYFGNIFCRSPIPRAVDIFFVIAPKHNTSKQKVKAMIQQLEAKEILTPFEVEFDSDKISLDIPKEGISAGSWRLEPLVFPSEIQQRSVGFANKSGSIQCLQLLATLPGLHRTPLPAHTYPISLRGARTPTEVKIVLDAFTPSVVESPPSPSLPSPSDGSGDVPPKPEEKIAEVLLQQYVSLRQSSGSDQQTQVESQATPKQKDPRTANVTVVQKQPSAHKGLFGIPGVTVDGRTSFIVTNSAQSFSWDDHGLNLHVPQDSLPAGVPDCRLDFITSPDGECLLPPDHESFSPVYWVRSSPHCRFQKPLTLEIQHWAKVTSTTELLFVRALCSQEKLPYEFKEIKKECSFSVGSSFASLQVKSFSGYQVAGRHGRVERLYFGSTFTRSMSPLSIDIFFVVALDHRISRRKVKKHFKKLKAEKNSTFAFEFERDTIYLEPPRDEISAEVWTVKPLVNPPKISRHRVDSANRSTSVISQQLRATLPGDWTGPSPPLSHSITLRGAREPTQVTIIWDPPSSPPTFTVVRAERPPLTGMTPLMPPSPPVGTLLSPSTFFPPQFTGHGVSTYPVPYRPGPFRAIEAPAMSIDLLMSHVGISRELLDREVSGPHLRQIAALLPNWQLCAKPLGLTDNQIQDLHDKTLADNTAKAHELLEKWHQKLAFNAKYIHLVELCLSLDNATGAVGICKLLK